MHPSVKLRSEWFADSLKEESPGDSRDGLSNELEEFTAADRLYVLLRNRGSLGKLRRQHFVQVEDVVAFVTIISICDLEGKLAVLLDIVLFKLEGSWRID